MLISARVAFTRKEIRTPADALTTALTSRRPQLRGSRDLLTFIGCEGVNACSKGLNYWGDVGFYLENLSCREGLLVCGMAIVCIT
jgi:hypothetical protein